MDASERIRNLVRFRDLVRESEFLWNFGAAQPYVGPMNEQKFGPTTLLPDAAVLCAFASVVVLVHFLLGNGYGFHRDGLQFLDDARHLHWGFVAYPPLTAFCGRVAIHLFGIAPGVFRLPAALANAVSLVVVGLIARELGGKRPAQVLALFAAFPIALALSSVLQC